MQTTEYDDMYYSSADRTEYIQPEAAQQAYDAYAAGSDQTSADGGVVNPEYATEGSGTVINNYYGEDYFDGRPYSSYNQINNYHNRSAYSVIDPYWGIDPYRAGFNRGFHSGFNRWGAGFYDPFMYDPFFYDPFFSPFRPGFSMSIGMGMGFGGWGGYGMWPHNRGMYGMGMFGNPYGMGMFGNPYGFGGMYNGFYGGGFNRGIYGNQYMYDRPLVQQRTVQYGPRDNRGGAPATGDRTDRSVGGRPDRGTLSGTDEQQQRVNPGSVPGRPSQNVGTQQGEGARQAIESRPSRTNYYDPRSGQRSTGREGIQPRQQQQQQQQVRPSNPTQQQQQRMSPQQRRGNQLPATQPQQRPQQRNNPLPSRSNEQRSVTPSRSMEQRSSPMPSRSFEQRSSTPAPSSTPSNSGGGGRPARRGGN